MCNSPHFLSASLFWSGNRSDDSNRKQAGTPGTPGSQDLAAALRRLTLRRDNYMSERRFFEDERERKLQELSEKDGLSEGRGGEDGSLTPTDSIMSLGLSSLHSGLSGFSFYGPRSYLPEKLQIVKPLEGDLTGRRRHSLYLYLSSSSSSSSSSSPSSPTSLPTVLLGTLWSLVHQDTDALDRHYSFYFRHTQPHCLFEI